MKRKAIILPLISALFVILTSCGDKYSTVNGFTWGTDYHIIYKGTADLHVEIDSVLRYIDSELSMFNPASTVSRINNNEDSIATVAFAEVFAIAKDVSMRSGGLYDPTVAPLVELWGFGREEVEAEPSEEDITAALALVGIDKCYIDSACVVHKKSPQTRFDFSSVAKGYGVDAVADMLESKGIKDYMVNIGGEIVARGYNPGHELWKIQIDAPVIGPEHKKLTIVDLGPERTSMASSGNYRNYHVDKQGNVYGHTISPQTGYPVVGKILAATTRALSNCGLCDALATACMAIGDSDKAQKMVHCADADPILVVAVGDSAVIVDRIGVD